MPSPIESLLDRLEELKRPGGARGAARLEKMLAQAARRRFRDAASLIRFHEILLFLRAYPQSPALLRQTEQILKTFAARVAELRAADAWDFQEFGSPLMSGIAGTALSAVFSYDLVRRLAESHPSRVALDWEDYAGQERFAAVMSRALPLVVENAYVETYFSLRAWLRAARDPRQSELAWLLRCFARLPVPDREKALLFDSLKLWLRWELGDSPATRTRLKIGARPVFYHHAPLLQRRDVSLAREMADGLSLPVVRLSRAEGERVLAAGRDAMAVRFRELHGFTYGDARSVRRADAGRGLEIYVWGVPPERRLPLLAYHAALFCKNGVPHGYAEALTLCERSEVGLNLFHTFREGESAWIYARLLRLFRQLLGVEVVSVDPYQLGHLNSEGIESGAFWFYRKLGFRPVRSTLAELVRSEERKLSTRAGYRTGARLLRQLASGHVLFETSPDARRGDWDNFHIRNLGHAVQRRMAARFKGDAQRMRRNTALSVARALALDASALNDAEREAFSNLAPLLARISGIARWSDDEKRDAARIIRAKASTDELRYLHLLQRHDPLRAALIKIGSRTWTRETDDK
ncbi:MAG TPA: hypothetical protein VNA19_01860 [Pyrinomonadaceae bacterium]|nr:hypothetical protein [Pyrinomonadaceae bacterium]